MAQGLGVCSKSPEEIEEWVDTLPAEGSVVAGSGSDTLLYTCNHFCELQGHQKGEVIENIRRMKAGKQESCVVKYIKTFP